MRPRNVTRALRGGPAWAVLAVAVVAYEAAAPAEHLLTAACARSMERHPVLTRAAILVTAAHLLGVLNPRLDPFCWLFAISGKTCAV